MSNFKFNYRMEITFSIPVIKHCFSLRCIPFNNEYQKITDLSIDISPSNITTETIDGFGNNIITDRIIEPHTEFYVNVSGIAEVNVENRKDEGLNGIYKYHSKYTKIGTKLSAFCDSVLLSGNFQNDLVEIMSKIQGCFTYKSFATDVNTTAEEALALGYGVCQDFAHILIAVCRHLNIPARYVVGIIKGVGETHAWVEVYNNQKWIGVDPTNNKFVDNYYLKLSHGRDFADCSVNRGLFIGGGTQTQKIVAELKEV